MQFATCGGIACASLAGIGVRPESAWNTAWALPTPIQDGTQIGCAGQVDLDGDCNPQYLPGVEPQSVLRLEALGVPPRHYVRKRERSVILTVPAPQDMADGDPLKRILRWLRNTRAEAERLAARASRLAESLDDFVYSLAVWERNPAALAQLASGDAHELARQLKDEFFKDAALKLAARQGVGRIEFSWQPDGTALARIDAQYEVGLSPKLGVLLEVLAADEGVSADGFVGWKGIDQVRKELLRRAGVQVSKPNLNTMLWRLRAALRKAGLSPDLIQRNPRLGLRLALRRSTPASGAPPLPAAA